MTDTKRWTDPTWSEVRADVDIAQLMRPLSSFKLKIAPKAAGYTVAHNDQPLPPDCFAGVTLFETGEGQMQLKSIPGLSSVEPLPPYNADSADQYLQISDLLGSYLTQHSELNRLEGIIEIPCHANGARLNRYQPPIPN